MQEGRTHYNKLIRDKVPENMRTKGVEFEVRTLSPEDFRTELLKKVGEEASGLESATSKEELVSELADVMAVLEEVKKLEGITEDELQAALLKNFEKKGGFNDRVFLEWSGNSDNYQTNEKKG